MEAPPKSAVGVRTVAIPPAVVPELERHLAAFVPSLAPSERLFTGPKGATPRRSNFNAVWSRARVKVGRPDLHLHDCRHDANTLAASAGASTRELMSRLGHASPAAALRYQHATAERDHALAARIDDLITGSAPRLPELRVLQGAG